MNIYTARVRYVDIREIYIEADSDEEAAQKYAEGNWVDEHTVDFYADEEIRPLSKASPTQGDD